MAQNARIASCSLDGNLLVCVLHVPVWLTSLAHGHVSLLQSMEIPTVDLAVHADIARAAATLRDASRIDLDALGLSAKVGR